MSTHKLKEVDQRPCSIRRRGDEALGGTRLLQLSMRHGDERRPPAQASTHMPRPASITRDNARDVRWHSACALQAGRQAPTHVLLGTWRDEDVGGAASLSERSTRECQQRLPRMLAARSAGEASSPELILPCLPSLPGSGILQVRRGSLETALLSTIQERHRSGGGRDGERESRAWWPGKSTPGRRRQPHRGGSFHRCSI